MDACPLLAEVTTFKKGNLQCELENPTNMLFGTGIFLQGNYLEEIGYRYKDVCCGV